MNHINDQPVWQVIPKGAVLWYLYLDSNKQLSNWTLGLLDRHHARYGKFNTKELIPDVNDCKTL